MIKQAKPEAKRLYDLGFAIHWLHKQNKRPIESGWTTGPRHTWQYLDETYIDDLNVGVRLGTPSKIGDHYLGVLDVDVKSTDKADAQEAAAYVKTLLKGATLPAVTSGRGNGSMHYYFLMAAPSRGFIAARSEKTVSAFMPSVKATGKNTFGLTPAQIEKGYRLRPAWEVGVMGDGQQVVLPPSVHPDSKKNYLWAHHLKTRKQLGLLDLEHLRPEAKVTSPGQSNIGPTDEKFSFEAVDVVLFDVAISEKMFTWITTGEGVEDRSASLLPICKSLYKAGLNQNEILSVLTDTDNWISACGYEHAQTKNRARAAHWIYKYSLKKVVAEANFDDVFKQPFDMGTPLTPDELEADQDPSELEHWTVDLDTTEKGFLKPTFKNCKLLIENALEGEHFLDEAPAVVGHNEFAGNDFYTEDTPWGMKAGEAITDTSILHIKNWCIRTRGIEFTTNTINEVVQHLSYVNKFHPVRDYVKSLQWDGVKRVDTWIKDYAKGVAPEPYLSDISRKFLVAMVERIFRPGCMYRQVLILEGPQEAGKSSIARALGAPWFTDAPLNIGDKDSIMTMQSNWIIELGELSALNKADSLILKAFISQQTDRIRPPYGRRMVDFPRQSVFIGTTNDEHYFKDPTGNTRFWPVKVGDVIDFKGCAAVRDQLIAEAYHLFLNGETLWLENPESKRQAVEQQGQREVADEWLPVIRDVLGAPTWVRPEFEVKDLASQLSALGAQRMTAYDVFRITTTLKKLGYESYREGSGVRRRLWRLKGAPTHEIGGDDIDFFSDYDGPKNTALFEQNGVENDINF